MYGYREINDQKRADFMNELFICDNMTKTQIMYVAYILLMNAYIY